MRSKVNNLDIKFTKLTKDEWLKVIPLQIHKLCLEYGFFYSKNIVRFDGNIVDLIDRRYYNNRHKMLCYRDYDERQLYFVTYCKNYINVYYCNDYYGEPFSKVKYFVNKFWKYYLEAKHMKEMVERMNER
jgi:hypothetical protein